MPGGEEEEEGEAQVLRHGGEGEREGRREGGKLCRSTTLWAAGAVGNSRAELLDQFSALFVLHAITQAPVSLVQAPVCPGVLRVV